MKPILILMCLHIPYAAFSQQENFYGILSAQFSTYNMGDLKEFQEEYVKSSGIDLKTVASFPPYIGYAMELGTNINPEVSWGLLLGYNSTGGRVDYQDYSGTVRMDQLLKYYSLGGCIKSKINKSEPWPLYISLSASFVRSTMKITSEVVIGDFNESEKLDVFSNNLGLVPSIILQHNVNPLFYIQGMAGYEIQFAGKVHPTNNTEVYLTKSSGDPLQIRWDGIRIGIGIGIRLDKISGKETENN